jgi:hypothetical protein
VEKGETVEPLTDVVMQFPAKVQFFFFFGAKYCGFEFLAHLDFPAQMPVAVSYFARALLNFFFKPGFGLNQLLIGLFQNLFQLFPIIDIAPEANFRGRHGSSMGNLKYPLYCGPLAIVSW